MGSEISIGVDIARPGSEDGSAVALWFLGIPVVSSHLPKGMVMLLTNPRGLESAFRKLSLPTDTESAWKTPLRIDDDYDEHDRWLYRATNGFRNRVRLIALTEGKKRRRESRRDKKRRKAHEERNRFQIILDDLDYLIQNG